MSKRDFYEILGIPRTADEQQIKSAYRKLALDNHPDRNPGDKQAEERFKEAAEAYSILADQEKRNRYDQFGHAGVSGTGSQGLDPTIFSDFGDIFGGLGDVFGFGGIVSIVGSLLVSAYLLILKLLGEDKMVQYYWDWFQNAIKEDKPWELHPTQIHTNKVHEDMEMLYPPENKSLEKRNNRNLLFNLIARALVPIGFLVILL